MSFFITTTTTSFDLPVAGWLTKMISLPFGRSRWISRFFVLLDSELRFYKDEHSDSASQILNLRKVCQVIPTPTSQHPFCFRLEPQQYTTESVMRPWIIECKSEADMENWISAIQNRIMKYAASPSSSIKSNSSSSILSPKTPNNNNNKEQQQESISSSRVVSSYSMMNNASPEVYRMPTLPLRCTNLTEDHLSKEESLLIRRNKKLAPIIVTHQQQTSSLVVVEEEESPQTSFSTSTTCSSSSTLLSPTGAVLGPLISPGIIDRYNHYNKPSSSSSSKGVVTASAVVIVAVAEQQKQQQQQQQQRQQQQCDQQQCDSSSPTYLMYKKRFHL